MSLTHAWSGLTLTVTTQRNAKIHLAAAVATIVLAVWLGLETRQFAILVLMIGAVISSEAFNTAIEAIVDLLSPEWHEQAKIAKDASAGAVLILAMTSVVVGLLILGPPLWERILAITGRN